MPERDRGQPSFTLELEAMAHGGDALGRYEGKVIFVPLGIPGEVVRVELVDDHSRYAGARLLQVLEPSPDRVSPPCPYFGRCGGCQWQHIAYEAQLRLKRSIVISQLERIGKQIHPLVHPMIGMHEPWAYRNHVQLRMGERGQMGYYALKSHETVAVDACLLAHPLLDELWAALRVELVGLQTISLRAGIATGEQMVIFEGTTGAPPALEMDLPVCCLYRSGSGTISVMAGKGYYHERLLERTFRVSALSFFQPNTSQAERLIEVVRRYLSLRPPETLLDAYCGVGTFAFSLASQVKHVVGIESSPWAIEDAVANGCQDAVELVQGDVADVLQELRLTCEAAVIDPPRSGCTLGALQALARCGPDRLVYVSCDPASLARDVLRLSSLGYVLVEVQPVDLFPQTFHIESVALLQRE